MEKRHFTENQKNLIGGVAILIFVVFSAAICWFVGKPMVKFVSNRRSSECGWTATACGVRWPMWA